MVNETYPLPYERTEVEDTKIEDLDKTLLNVQYWNDRKLELASQIDGPAIHYGLSKAEHNLLDLLVSGGIGTSGQRGSITRILKTLKANNTLPTTQLNSILRNNY